MTTAIDKPKTLQERVGDRIRDQIGDLMTDEDLKLLVDKALHEAFFTERVDRDSYGSVRGTKPAPVVELVRELLKARVDAACSTWLAEHKDKLGQHIDDAVGKGFLAFFQGWLDMRVQGHLGTFFNNVKQSLGIRGY